MRRFGAPLEAIDTMELQQLTVNARNESGKGPARRTRVEGEIPGVIYGRGQAPASVSLNLRTLERMLQSRASAHVVLQLEAANAPELNGPVLLKDVQRHPVRETIMHVDFMRIDLAQRIQTIVMIDLVGQPKGVIEGGVLEHQLREIEIESLAMDAPERLTFNIAGLGIGDTLHVADLEVAEGITVLTDSDRVIASVHAPRVSSATATAEGEVEAEEGEAEAAAE